MSNLFNFKDFALKIEEVALLKVEIVKNQWGRKHTSEVEIDG